jgi:hypothetical protein
MLFLVKNQPGRVGKRHDNDRNVTPVEFHFERFHLAEVSLANQSSEMSEKDQQQMLLKVIPDGDRVASKIKQRQLVKRDLFGHLLSEGL